MLNLDLDRSVETCLDPEQMRAHLQPLLAPHGTVEAVRIAKAHRSASRRRDPHPLLALYEVEVRDAGGAAPRTLRCYGKVCRAGVEAAAPLAAGNATPLPALAMLLWAWPDDAGLPQLPRLLDPEAARPFWGEAARAVEAVRYEPERRATLRYTRARGDALYAKTFSDESGAAIHRRFDWFWARAQEDAGAPLVARPLRYSAGDRTLWQDAATGTPLRDWLHRGDAWLQPLARAIATVHEVPSELAGARRHDTAHWLVEAHRRRQKIVRALPALARRADGTVAAIEQAASQLPAHAPVTLHGDFHVDQAWFDGGRIVLFDFDEFVLGDPMQDLAAFLVRLPEEADAQSLGTPWIRAYAQHAPRLFCPIRLAWHLAVQQLLRASRAFVFQVPDWRAEVERRLAYAEALALQAQVEGAR
ncbi:hypothetical protein GCM10028796_16620 [Ramlibacter monticola]|uniref:Aminoglycoside phosphotransferase family protein n=1 Tax=Ramlibacter monticola TaxID=1926872 RepID=A0A936YVV9_9BURK|nr:aminoglycoside phosphotransferase family protein [Ramlibacter monticola]MBL0390489.1 aminoglycoside phosphotransferase family protein [Ramlibacter monticola]